MDTPFLIRRTPDAADLPLPFRATPQAAGLDLHANTAGTLAPGERLSVPTGICIALPAGYEAQLRARSGLATRHGIGLVNAPATIDADYRGEIKVTLINWGDKPFAFQRGDRIAQMVINRVAMIDFCEVAELPPSQRGEGGFGHTGT